MRADVVVLEVAEHGRAPSDSRSATCASLRISREPLSVGGEDAEQAARDLAVPSGDKDVHVDGR